MTVVLGITAPKPAVIEFDRVIVWFTVNGQGRAQSWPTGAMICVESPDPADCDLDAAGG